MRGKIELIDDNNVRICIEGNKWYFLEVPETNNLALILDVFIRGYEEGEKDSCNKRE
jgi:hypothetical protein